MNRFQRLIAYVAMTAALLNAAAFVAAQQTGQPYINRVTGPGVIDPGGAMQVNPTGVNNTYSSSVVALAVPSGGTDVACLTGSATKKVSVSKVTVSGTAATQVTIPVKLMKNATIDTQGTGTAVTPYTYWSTNATATANVTAYTVSPTIADTVPATLAIMTLTLPTTSTNVATGPAVFAFGNSGAGQPTLLSASQQVCVNLNSTSITTGSMHITFEWIEY